MLSLRQRAWISGGLSALVSLGVRILLLYSYLNQRALDRFDRTLVERHTQVVVALSYAADDPERLDELLFDPTYQAPFSGRYWQITGPGGATCSSDSLLGASLPGADEASTTLALRDAGNPDVDEVHIAGQRITLEDGAAWVVSVAETLAQLKTDRRDLRQSLVAAFALWCR